MMSEISRALVGVCVGSRFLADVASVIEEPALLRN